MLNKIYIFVFLIVIISNLTFLLVINDKNKKISLIKKDVIQKEVLINELSKRPKTITNTVYKIITTTKTTSGDFYITLPSIPNTPEQNTNNNASNNSNVFISTQTLNTVLNRLTLDNIISLGYGTNKRVWFGYKRRIWYNIFAGLDSDGETLKGDLSIMLP